MKNVIRAIILVLVACCQVFAQSQPIMGYDKVEWGATVEVVRKAYNLGNTVLEKDKDTPDLAILTQKNVSEKIKERTFAFINWKGNQQLCAVIVTYWDASNSSVQSLLTGLTGKFGEKTDTKRQSQHKFNNWYLYTETTTFGKYSPDLVVELVHIYTNWAGGGEQVITDANGNVVMRMKSKDVGIDVGDSPLQIRYTWKKFLDGYKSRDAEF